MTKPIMHGCKFDELLVELLVVDLFTMLLLLGLAIFYTLVIYNLLNL